MAENVPVARTRCVVIDAGHGGMDGGATSCTGRLESTYNLEIALRLNDLMHFLGVDTKMIRTEDVSIHTGGTTIAAQKMSDLRERVRITNETPGAILISIHQNYFPQSQYRGAVMLYPLTQGSQQLAETLQQAFVSALDPGNKRLAKQVSGVYLMEHIQCPGVLIECGFLSNPEEEALLSDPGYQKKLCGVIACTLSEALFAE